MASNGTGQRPGSSSFLEYMTNQRAKSGRGLQALDAAIGATLPKANAGAGIQQTPAAPAVVPSPTASEPPLTNGPEMVQTQPDGLKLLDQDKFYRDMGRLPTAADLAASQFAVNFRTQQGRSPTKAEVVAHLYRRPDLLPQVSSDYKVG
jgi:hypothetical protein